jgi:hypothetical protein
MTLTSDIVAEVMARLTPRLILVGGLQRQLPEGSREGGKLDPGGAAQFVSSRKCLLNPLMVEDQILKSTANESVYA